jgi:hypothetical protein
MVSDAGTTDSLTVAALFRTMTMMTTRRTMARMMVARMKNDPEP